MNYIDRTSVRGVAICGLFALLIVFAMISSALRPAPVNGASELGCITMNQHGPQAICSPLLPSPPSEYTYSDYESGYVLESESVENTILHNPLRIPAATVWTTWARCDRVRAENGGRSFDSFFAPLGECRWRAY